MPRNFKCRRVCALPDNRVFIPQQSGDGAVTLTIEELETLRLCDLEGLEQDEASVSMNVSRATFQRMLYQARRKTADALCSGKVIEIGGGNYELAEHRCGCRRRCRSCRFESQPQTTGEWEGKKV
jgi:Predicted DNA-binding proteins